MLRAKAQKIFVTESLGKDDHMLSFFFGLSIATFEPLGERTCVIELYYTVA